MDDADYLSKVNLQSRSREALSSYLQTLSWHGFYTATFAKPSKYAQGTLDMVGSILRKETIRSFIVAEQHLSGFWHSHGLVAYYHQAGFEHTGDLSHTKKELSRLGYCQVGEIKSLEAVTAYCSKYLMKDDLMDWSYTGRKKHWIMS